MMVSVSLKKRVINKWLFAILLYIAFVFINCTSKTDTEENNDASSDGTSFWEDPISGLLWQNPPGPYIAFQADADDYCENLEIGQFYDWRLPSLTELRSFVRGCSYTEINGKCPASDACLPYENNDCWNEFCLGCKNDSGPGDGACYWDQSIKGNCNVEFWSSTKAEFSESFGQLYYSIRFDVAKIDTIIEYADNPSQGFGVRCVRYD